MVLFQKDLGANEHILSYGSSILEDSSSLSSLDISDGASLAINARLLGGKRPRSFWLVPEKTSAQPKVEKPGRKRTKKKRTCGTTNSIHEKIRQCCDWTRKEAWTQLQCCLICLLFAGPP
ncbi:hypothetical protein OSTOST_19533 [Ostertagia ostertagi]